MSARARAPPLGLLDPRRLLDHAHLRELGAKLLEIPAAGEVGSQLAHRHDRRGVADVLERGRPAAARRRARASAAASSRAERDEVAAAAAARLGGEHPRHLAVRRAQRRQSAPGPRPGP